MEKREYISTIVLVLLFSAGLQSCSRRAEVDMPAHQPRLVLHGYVEVGTLFQVSLGKTTSILTPVNDSNHRVENGWVLLFEENIFLDTLKYESSLNRFVSNTIIAESGKTYRVVAGAPGFLTIEAQTRSPQNVPTLSIQHIKNSWSNNLGILMNDVKFSFQDPPGQSNYYLAALYPPGENFTCVYSYDPVIERFTGNLTPVDQSSCINNDQILFMDKSFNGTIKEIIISAAGIELEPWTDPSGNVHRSYLKKYHVNGDYYNYYKNMIALGMEGPSMAEPVNIKGNVKNGYGLFTVFTVTTDSLP